MTEKEDLRAAAEEERRRYKQAIADAVAAVERHEAEARRELLRVLLSRTDLYKDTVVGMTVTAGFRALTDANQAEIAAAEERGELDVEAVRFQGVCRIEFAKFLAWAELLELAHDELNAAGDEIAKLLCGESLATQVDVGLAKELGRMKDMVQGMMSLSAPGREKQEGEGLPWA